MNKTDNIKAARCTDALLNYETVMYFSNEDLEVRRYADAVGDYQVGNITLPHTFKLFSFNVLCQTKFLL